MSTNNLNSSKIITGYAKSKRRKKELKLKFAEYKLDTYKDLIENMSKVIFERDDIEQGLVKEYTDRLRSNLIKILTFGPEDLIKKSVEFISAYNERDIIGSENELIQLLKVIRMGMKKLNGFENTIKDDQGSNMLSDAVKKINKVFSKTVSLNEYKNRNAFINLIKT